VRRIPRDATRRSGVPQTEPVSFDAGGQLGGTTMSNVLSDGIVRITSQSGAVADLPGDALRWEEPFEDPETGELVHLATIAAEEFQGSEVTVERNDGGYEIDTEDLIVTLEDDLDIGDADD
jgi:hypothetical protein